MDKDFYTIEDIELPQKPVRGKKSKAKKRLIIVGVAILAVFLIAVGGIGLVIDNYLNLINYTDSVGGDGYVDDDIDKSLSNSPQSDIDDMLGNIRDNVDADYEALYDKDVMNVLFIGSDARHTGDGSRSDAMILISINKRTEKIIATSYLRDIFVSIPGKWDDRLNAAYAYGGTDLLFETLEENFKVRVDQFVLTDFQTFVKLIDSIGGVELNITAAEADYLNKTVSSSTPMYDGYDGGLKRFPGAGTYRLNGDQTLNYSRIRKIDSDRQRSQRQRNVLSAIFDEVKDMNYTELNNFANTVLPLVSTNVSKQEIVMLMLRMPELVNYDMEQLTVPAEGTYSYVTIDHKNVIGVDFDENVALISEKVYGYEQNTN